MATTAGPATGTAELLFGAGPTTSIEVQVPAGLPSLGPAQAPYADPQSSTFQNVPATLSSATNVTNKAIQFPSLSTGIQFSLPA